MGEPGDLRLDGDVAIVDHVESTSQLSLRAAFASFSREKPRSSFLCSSVISPARSAADVSFSAK